MLEYLGERRFQRLLPTMTPLAYNRCFLYLPTQPPATQSARPREPQACSPGLRSVDSLYSHSSCEAQRPPKPCSHIRAYHVCLPCGVHTTHHRAICVDFRISVGSMPRCVLVVFKKEYSTSEKQISRKGKEITHNLAIRPNHIAVFTFLHSRCSQLLQKPGDSFPPSLCDVLHTARFRTRRGP